MAKKLVNRKIFHPRHPRESGDSEQYLELENSYPLYISWIPAFAGMTTKEKRGRTFTIRKGFYG